MVGSQDVKIVLADSYAKVDKERMDDMVGDYCLGARNEKEGKN